MKKLLLFFIIIVFALPGVVRAEDIAERLAGRIVLNTSENGEAWYIYPENNRRYFLGRPADAFGIMRELGVGINEHDFQKIPQDGMSVEENTETAEQLAGRIVIRVNKDGEAWYVDPTDLHKHFLGRPSDAFQIMRKLSLGISRLDLARIHKHGYGESLNEYSRYEFNQIVSTKYEDFHVDHVKIDLDDPELKVMTLTANHSDCKDGCPAKSVGEYVINNNGFAGLNGSYFDTAWSRSNYYFAPVYNSKLDKMINEEQLKYWTTGPMVVFDKENNAYYYKDSRNFKSVKHFEDTHDAEIRAAISNRPRLVDNGKNQLIDWNLDQSQIHERATRTALGYKKGDIYLLVVKNATVPQLADVAVAMNMEYALNLDGGHSTALFYNDEYMYGPGRQVPNAIIFKRK